jgi:hypothetical protein
MTKRKIVKAARCLVCNHPDRSLIEHARVAGCSLDTLSAKYSVSRDAIWRHFRNHLSDEQRADILASVPMSELAAKAAAEGTSVLEYFSIIRGILMQRFQLAASVGDNNAAGALAGRLTEVLREIGRATGQLGSMASSNLTINNTTIVNSPIFATLQANLMTALAPYPEARAAVVAALERMDQPATEMKVINVPKTIEHIPT